MSTWSTFTEDFHWHFFKSVMIVACEHRLLLATCGVEQKPEIPLAFAPQTFSRESLRHSHFTIMWLVGSTERKQTTNTKGKECGSDVSSRFFGGALRDIPKNGCGGDYEFFYLEDFVGGFGIMLCKLRRLRSPDIFELNHASLSLFGFLEDGNGQTFLAFPSWHK